MNIRYPFLNLATVNEPYIGEIRDAVARVIDSGRYIGSNENKEFEKELATMIGTSNAIGVGNGLDALRLIIRGYIELGRLHRGDEVIVPANSFVASALAVTECGLDVRFADVDPDTANIDWARLPLDSRTRAVMPVHLYGRVCPVPDTLPDGMIVIEDNAQAIGASLNGRMTGAIGHAAGMSFYPTKNVGALGDAGAVTTCDDELAHTVRMLGNYGADTPYHNIYAGINSRLDPIQAAILRAKLPHMAAENATRRRNAEVYLTEIDNPLIITPRVPDSPENHVWHQFVVRIADGRRDAFRRHMAAHGVETAVHYPTPIHRQPCYAATCRHTSLPVAEQLADQVVSLPVSRCTSPADAAEIAGIANLFRG